MTLCLQAGTTTVVFFPAKSFAVVLRFFDFIFVLLDVIKPDAGVGDGLGDHALLSGPVRGGQPVRGAVLVDRRARDDRQHRVVVALGIAEPFQNQHRGPFTQAGAISGGGKRFTPPIGSQPALAGELGKHRRCGHHRDPAGQRQSRSPRYAATDTPDGWPPAMTNTRYPP